jgi:hypothetical protein
LTENQGVASSNLALGTIQAASCKTFGGKSTTSIAAKGGFVAKT